MIAAPFGVLGLKVRGEALLGIDFLPPDAPLRAPSDPVAALAARRLAAYFEDPGASLELPLCLTGSPFRLRVWRALRQIAVGATLSYAELAAVVGSSARAVGQALGDNPLPIVIPCHRVVARHGLGGFAHAASGPALAIKHWLLRHEGALGR